MYCVGKSLVKVILDEALPWHEQPLEPELCFPDEFPSLSGTPKDNTIETNKTETNILKFIITIPCRQVFLYLFWSNVPTIGIFLACVMNP